MYNPINRARQCHVMSESMQLRVCVFGHIQVTVRWQKQSHPPGRVDKFHDEDRTHDGETQKERQKSARSASEPKNRKQYKYHWSKVESPGTRHCGLCCLIFQMDSVASKGRIIVALQDLHTQWPESTAYFGGSRGCVGNGFFHGFWRHILLLIAFEEQNSAVRRIIARLIFHINVSKFSGELRLGFTEKCMKKWKVWLL